MYYNNYNKYVVLKLKSNFFLNISTLKNSSLPSTLLNNNNKNSILFLKKNYSKMSNNPLYATLGTFKLPEINNEPMVNFNFFFLFFLKKKNQI
jgi:hypothetical protein